MQMRKPTLPLFSLNATAPAVVASAALLPPGEEIFDIRPAVQIAWPWWETVFEAFLAVLVFWLLWFFYQWLLAPVQRVQKKLVQSPQKQALRAIERLRLSPVWEHRQMKEICETLAVILKTYSHEAFNLGMGAPSTTDELLAALDHSAVVGEVYGQIRELLLACDLIKFTGKESSDVDPEVLLSALTNLVRQGEWLK